MTVEKVRTMNYSGKSKSRSTKAGVISGKTKVAYKIDNGKISSPIILDKSFYLAKDSSIIRLN